MAKRQKTRTLKPGRKGQKRISFKPGALKAQLGVPAGKKIPSSKLKAARAGRYGPKAKRRVQFRDNVLRGGGRRKRS